MRKSFRGAGVALITPFKDDLSIDFNALGRIVDNQVNNGIDFLVALGTTAETPTLSDHEKQAIVDYVCNKVKGKIPVVVGVGGNNTQSVIESLKKMDLSKVDGILSVVPYYSKPTQEGIFQHFMAIAEASPLPIILYNVPGRTGVSMSAETTVRLAHASEKFVATKEASGNLSEISKIIRDKPEGFIVLSGDDALALPIISVGGEGVISVAANVVPKALAELIHAAMNNDFRSAAKWHSRLQTIFDALFVEGNPGGAKAALNSLGIIENVLRLPLVMVSSKTYDILAGETKKIIL